MKIIDVVRVVLELLKGVLAALTRANGPQVAIRAIESAIASLEMVQGSEVTLQQLEGLKFEPKW